MELPPLFNAYCLTPGKFEKRPAFFFGGPRSGEPAPFETPFVIADGVHYTRGALLHPDGWYAHTYSPTAEFETQDIDAVSATIFARH